MNVAIIDNLFSIDIYGFSGIANNKDYVETAFKLMDKMWQVVNSNKLKNKGLNIWVYELGEKVFAGVELDEVSQPDTKLEHKIISLTKYAYYKHIGPYNLIKQSVASMTEELKSQGIKTKFPYIEIYGHWTNNENKLETDLIMNLI